MERYQRKYQALQVLHQIVEPTQTAGVLAALNVEQRTDLAALSYKLVSAGVPQPHVPTYSE